MAYFGMGAVNSAIELTIKYYSAADPRADGHINKACLRLTGPPSRLCQRRSISVIFHCHAHTEFALQWLHDVGPFPSGQGVHPAVDAGPWINRAAASNSYSGDGSIRGAGALLQHLPHTCQPIGKPTLGSRRRFHLVHDPPVFRHHGNCNFCPSDINGPNHACVFLSLSGDRKFPALGLKKEFSSSENDAAWSTDYCS